MTQFYPSLSIHPGDLTFGFAGAQDNGTQRYSGSLAWTTVTCGDGGWTIVDPSQTNTAYSSCQNIQLEKTNNGGSGWSLAERGIASGDRVAFIPPFVMDPSDPLRLYFGTYRLWRSADGAGGWIAVSPDLTGGGSGTIRAIGAGVNDSQTVYTGATTGQVWVTNKIDSGDFSAWQNHSAGLPARFVTQIQVDTQNAATAYVSYSGFSGIAAGDNKGHVFRTQDRGASWLDISGNLPNIPVNDMQLDPDLPGTIYAATDIGVFATSDAGLTWNLLGTGLPRVVSMGLRLHRATRTLRVATHGLGVWDIVVPLLPGVNNAPGIRSALPATAKPGSAALTITVTGSGFLPTSAVTFKGQALNATMLSATTLSATIPAASLTSASISSITVVNPAPGGGVSNALKFPVVATPAINSGGIVNAASYTSPPLTAGSLVSMFGSNLAPGVAAASLLPLPAVLNGVAVSVNGIAAGIVFVSPGQINFQVPWEITAPQATVVVSVGGSNGPSLSLPLAAASPAIFALNQSGTGQGAILISNTALLAGPSTIPGARPAAKGESVSVFCTGLGAVSPAQTSGQPAPSTLTATQAATTATIGAQPATVTFSGLAPGFVGLYQVNVTVPQNAPSGDAVPLVLTVGGAASNIVSNMVTLAVQ